ncbi:MAG: hypothetical protein JSV75_03820 [Candidatus Bathyarchaeota archaeon]|nr:MAG: hypothetical protein JSV75_03820 [Candidatus Bathyarchaeota archaeon]
MDEVEIHVEVEVNPTEDPDKVKGAVEKIFGSLEFETRSRDWRTLLIAKTKGIKGITKLRNLLRRERIRAAARRVFLGGIDEKYIVFYLNKQVAFVGHISFSKPTAESPLGPIKIQIQCDNPRELVEWLAPKPT